MSSVREVDLRRRRMDAIFERALLLGDNDGAQEAQSDYARHICVLVSGYVERSLAEIILAYAEGKCPAPLRSFLENTVKRLTNVDKDRLLQIVGSFDAKWRDELEAFVQDERQVALNSIVGLRNEIAH